LDIVDEQPRLIAIRSDPIPAYLHINFWGGLVELA
jgi:hypothetical protein